MHWPPGTEDPPSRANVHPFPLPSESSWPGLGTSRQLSGPGGFSSGIPSSSSSSSHSSPSPSLSVSSWELLGTDGQLSRVSWWPSPSLVEKITGKDYPLIHAFKISMQHFSRSWHPQQEQQKLVIRALWSLKVLVTQIIDQKCSTCSLWMNPWVVANDGEACCQQAYIR